MQIRSRHSAGQNTLRVINATERALADEVLGRHTFNCSPMPSARITKLNYPLYGRKFPLCLQPHSIFRRPLQRGGPFLWSMDYVPRDHTRIH